MTIEQTFSHSKEHAIWKLEIFKWYGHSMVNWMLKVNLISLILKYIKSVELMFMKKLYWTKIKKVVSLVMENYAPGHKKKLCQKQKQKTLVLMLMELSLQMILQIKTTQKQLSWLVHWTQTKMIAKHKMLVSTSILFQQTSALG